jgi:membrane protein DedA with SNARE-associated domain
MQALAIQYGYFGVFLIALIGALSIFVPIPYTVVIFTLGGFKSGGAYVFDPIWLALTAGFGSAIGEFSAYLVGLGGRKAIGDKYKKKMSLLAKVFNRYGPIVIFVFALTPLPDDLIFIPLGVMRYNVLKAFGAALIGKISMNFIVAYSGRLSIQAINSIFGVDSDWISALIGMTLALVLLAIVFIVMFKVDWETRLEKYMTEKDNKEQNSKSQRI